MSTASYSCPHSRRYATSKGGLVTLTNALAVELGPLGIRVNAVRALQTAPVCTSKLAGWRLSMAHAAGAAGRDQHADAARRLRQQRSRRAHFAHMRHSAAPTERRRAGFEALSKFHPVGRICEPEEIAQARGSSKAAALPQLMCTHSSQFVAFLGDATKSGFINGSALQIDGGIGGRLYDPA